jgi:hypothetical protein
MMVAITEYRFTSRVVGASDGRRSGAVVYAIGRRENDVFRGEELGVVTANVAGCCEACGLEICEAQRILDWTEEHRPKKRKADAGCGQES